LAVPRGLAEHLELDRNLVLDILPKTAVIAPAMSGKFSKIKSEDYSPQFPLYLMSKDLDLVDGAARESVARRQRDEAAFWGGSPQRASRRCRPSRCR
jgi:3-hydroxyisobutyrate dehydrogenase-like beta-hydroxyacid dehydrogenase